MPDHSSEQRGPRPYSHTATTDRVLSLLAKYPLGGKRFLDLGAGEGYLTRKLWDLLQARGERPEERIIACDLYPETFRVPEVECTAADFNGRIPFSDNAFDFIVCQEVIEHVPNQQHLMEEIFRLLRPGGTAWITTPNTLSSNSRVRSLFTGTMPLFDILPIGERDVARSSGHINPISVYYLCYFAKRAGFDRIDFSIDRIKRSGVCLSLPIFPLARICKWFHDARRRSLPYWGENRFAADALYAWRTFVGRTIILEVTRSIEAANHKSRTEVA
ncbi:MAG: class I SAM-dependent methyltransferase [Planctomycetota bacterium]|nr:class I SAM-dependent methyltransferase [Planctomycetota bacterium]